MGFVKMRLEREIGVLPKGLERVFRTVENIAMAAVRVRRVWD